MTHWLVCPSLADGAKTRSNLRDCQCGTQIWVSAALVTLVDSGTLAPRCAPCLYNKGYDPDQIIAIVCCSRWVEVVALPFAKKVDGQPGQRVILAADVTTALHAQPTESSPSETASRWGRGWGTTARAGHVPHPHTRPLP